MNNFLKKFKAKKNLEFIKSNNSKGLISKGEFIWMFGTKYQTLTDSSSDQTILRDEKGVRVAVPTEGLMKLIEQGLINKGSYLRKAEGEVSDNKPSDSKKISTDGRSAEGFPLNTIRNGRIKVSMNPSKWVDYHSGHSYDTHNSDKEHVRGDMPEVKKHVDKLMDRVKSEIHPKDDNKIRTQMEKVVGEMIRQKHVKEHGPEARKQGQGDPKILSDSHQFRKDSVKFEVNKLKMLLQESKQRKKDGK